MCLLVVAYYQSKYLMRSIKCAGSPAVWRMCIRCNGGYASWGLKAYARAMCVCNSVRLVSIGQ